MRSLLFTNDKMYQYVLTGMLSEQLRLPSRADFNAHRAAMKALRAVALEADDTTVGVTLVVKPESRPLIVHVLNDQTLVASIGDVGGGFIMTLKPGASAQSLLRRVVESGGVVLRFETGKKRYTLPPEGAEVVLEDSWLDIVKRAVSPETVQWLSSVTEEVGELLDWLDAAPEWKPVKKVVDKPAAVEANAPAKALGTGEQAAPTAEDGAATSRPELVEDAKD